MDQNETVQIYWLLQTGSVIQLDCLDKVARHWVSVAIS